MAHGKLLKGVRSISVAVMVEGAIFKQAIQYRVTVGDQPPSTIEEATGGLHPSQPDKVPQMELIPRPMKPVIARPIDTRNDVAKRGVGTRVQASGSPTSFIPDTCHTGDRAFAILGTVEEIAARVDLGHAG
jgi:hypothetical protein